MNWIKPDWPAASNIHAAVTLRSGGLSEGIYHSFNLADHVHDDAEKVVANRKIMSKMLNLPSEPIWLHQEHGNRVIRAENNIQLQSADASFTDLTDTVCAVLTADCLPILLASKDGTKIASIHAGWKSLLAGIVANTINEMGTVDMIAWLGPAIGINNFEVGKEVKDSFIKKNTKFASAFKEKNETKFLADIYQLAIMELASVGLTQVYGGGFCTVTDKQRFFSYRRDGETGRMATLIWRD
jgi:YfiH family protein